MTLAGCSSGGDEGNSREKLDSFKRNYTLEEDAYKGRKFHLNESGVVKYDAIVREGPALDFYVMEQSEFKAYDEQQRFEYIPDASRKDATSAEVDHELPKGKYAFVVDNTNAGTNPPADGIESIAHVDVTFTLLG